MKKLHLILKKHSNLCLLLILALQLHAQEQSLPKVSVADLEQKMHPSDSAAVAAILYKKSEVHIEYTRGEGFYVVNEVTMRIKIYKSQGYSWANQAVAYAQGTNGISENVYFSDAVTYNLIDGKIEKTKLKSEGEFDEKVNQYASLKKITMPNVKEGSIVDYKYTLKSNNVGKMREFDFQTSIPVDYAEYETNVPEYYLYNTKLKGWNAPQKIEHRRRKSIMLDNKISTDNNGNLNNNLDYEEVETDYIMKNLPAIKAEQFVNNMDNYTAAIVQELSKIQYPNQAPKYYSTSWDAVVNSIYELPNFGAELKKTGYFEEDLNTVLAEKNTEEEKVAAILSFVKAHVKWNNTRGYSCQNGVKKAYKEHVGNVADINLMLTAMLRASGLTADPVVLSTRQNGIALFPNRTAFDYVVAAVETPTGRVLLDATDTYSAPNVLPFLTLNWQGRLIRSNGYSETINLMPHKMSSDVVYLNYVLDPRGKATGKIRRQQTDHRAMQKRATFAREKQDDYLEKLENSGGKLEISDYARTNEKDVLKPLIEDYSFVAPNTCDIIAGKIYLNPMLFYAQRNNPFKQEERAYPVDFGFPFADQYNITVQIPDGYTVESLPAAKNISMEDNLGKFSYAIGQNGQFLQIRVISEIHQPIIREDQYNMLKNFYQNLIAKESEKVVLKKV